MSKLISIAVPAYNESKNIVPLYEEIKKVFDQIDYDFELVICENGSWDESLTVLEDLKVKDPRVQYISLSRNFGHQGGLLAAMSHSQGDAIITMDADLQHPPEVIADLLKKWDEGYEVVNTIAANRKSTLLRGLVDKAFYRLMDEWSGLKIGQADFRLVDRSVAAVLLNLNESQKFIRGLISWIGYRQTTIEYNVQKRRSGVSKFSKKHLFEFAFEGLTAFSVAPLRLMMKLGVLIFIPSAILTAYHLYLGLAHYAFGVEQSLPPGWATLVVIVGLFGSIQLLSLGILGEYVGRIYLEIKGRPNFIVNKENSNVQTQRQRRVQQNSTTDAMS